eukprot:TRINITY_DN4472_c0_g1_i1.p1 TRINITY_DN4472_c0_g1~~TRINITY_DN4472_c0_g1_i1.p1  ORF type:complete len:253 (+),score=38.55 TRINITY_DN4472_c0_g1_i1:80-838(+)
MLAKTVATCRSLLTFSLSVRLSFFRTILHTREKKEILTRLETDLKKTDPHYITFANRSSYLQKHNESIKKSAQVYASRDDIVKDLVENVSTVFALQSSDSFTDLEQKAMVLDAAIKMIGVPIPNTALTDINSINDCANYMWDQIQFVLAEEQRHARIASEQPSNLSFVERTHRSARIRMAGRKPTSFQFPPRHRALREQEFGEVFTPPAPRLKRKRSADSPRLHLESAKDKKEGAIKKTIDVLPPPAPAKTD